MTPEQIIAQLETLRAHCASRIDPTDPDSVWAADAAALDIAINLLREDSCR